MKRLVLVLMAVLALVAVGGTMSAEAARGGPGRGPGGAGGTGPQERPAAAGSVAGVDGATITVTTDQGSVKVVTSSSTTFEVNGAKAGLSDIKTGMFVRAEGTKSSDGSFAATRVVASTERPQRPQAPPQQ